MSEPSTILSGEGIAGADVRLSVPADSAYVAIIRSTTAGLAARCDLTLDEIEDLRLAVDEACALLIPLAAQGSQLNVEFALNAGWLEIRATVSAQDGARPSRDGIGWAVLEALASEATISVSGGQVAITLSKRSEASDL